MTLAHWDDIEPRTIDRAGLGGSWRFLGAAAGATRVGLTRITLEPGEVSTPAHVHASDEEIFYVLSGSGLLWQDGATCVISEGDTIVNRGRMGAHTLRGGDGGLDVLAFGTRTAAAGAYLPQLGAYWLMAPEVWLEVNPGVNPFDREPNLEWPEPGERPANVVAFDDAETMYGGILRHLAATAGATQSGLNWVSLAAGEEAAAPHSHSAEDELFVVLAGEGELWLWPKPSHENQRPTEPEERHPVRAGSVISRPAGTRVPHSFHATADGFTYLAYGTREPNDMVWYARSNKLFIRGLGLMARLELLDRFDGEPA